MDGSEIFGETFGKTGTNDTSLRIAYGNDVMVTGHTHCSVGGNPSPIVEGCLQSEGNITIDDQIFHYMYNVSQSNHNDHTLIDLSTHAKSRMWSCSHCPFDDYQKYYNYYGEFDYADRILQTAFRGEEMKLDNGNMDLGYYSKYGMKVCLVYRMNDNAFLTETIPAAPVTFDFAEFIPKAISYLSIWMYTIRQLEQSVADCEKGEFLQSVHFWDEAVALYTGSRGLVEGNNGDFMLHQADLRCQEFSTCGELSDSRNGQSHVNLQVFAHFTDGQYSLLHNRCEQARLSKQEIVRLMTIPLIQATLRYAHIIAHETYFNEKHGAQASLYALTILPLVHDCSPQDAAILHQQLKSKNTADVDFGAVRNAMENTYSCLKIECSEIGGIWDETNGDYKYDAYPCGRAQETSNSTGGVVGWTIGGLMILTALGVWTWRRRKMQENGSWQGDYEEGGFRDEPKFLDVHQMMNQMMKPFQKLQDIVWKHMGGEKHEEDSEEGNHEDDNRKWTSDDDEETKDTEEGTAEGIYKPNHNNCWQDDDDEEGFRDEPTKYVDNPKRTDRMRSNSYEI
ncbi:MAG: hypothetical protein SGBAC_006785 [Bacillariaceae sp.]